MRSNFLKRMFILHSLFSSFSFYVADPNASGGGTEPPEDEKFKEIDDPVTGKKVKIPKELEVFFGHVVSKTRETEKKQYEPLLTKVEKLESENKEFSDVKAELERIKLESMTAEERAQENAKKVIRDYEGKAKEALAGLETYKQKYEKNMVRNEIYASFEGTKLCNPEQVAMLLEAEGRAKVTPAIDLDGKPTDQDEVRLVLMIENDKKEVEKMEGTPKELFKKWIKMERNSHHVLNDLIPGGGGPKGKQVVKDGKRVDLSALPPADRLNAARAAGL
jgi:hypothetical protein